MSNRTASTPYTPSTAQASFDRCLVDSNLAAQSLGRRSRRKAFSLSLVIEAFLLGLVVLVPLLSSVAQPQWKSVDYVSLSAGAHWRGSRDVKPMRPNPKAWSKHDGLDYFLAAKAPRPVRPVADSSGEAEKFGDPTLLDPSGSDAPVSIDLHPVQPLAPPPEGIKKNSDKSPLKLSEPVVEAQLISRVEPRYPALAVQIHLQGAVRLRAVISREGRITSLEVVSGHPLLVQSALDAVRQWRYRPTMLDGEAVEVETTITVVFQLR